MKKVTKEKIELYEKYLTDEEKSEATVKKYVRDVTAFAKWADGRTVDKPLVLEYKRQLMEKYAPASVNAAISSINSFFRFDNNYECCVKTLKIQRRIFADKSKELTREEYERILTAAKNRKNDVLFYLVQTVAGTGLRISELKFVTCDAVNSGQAVINCKGKLRQVLLPEQLCKMLKYYSDIHRIYDGPVFVTKNGKPLDRSNVWKMLKGVCDEANVPREKVFPHNFRHLFAKTFYGIYKDIVRLADILGHSNINTTRIYTTETSEVHRNQIQRLGLLRC